MTSGRILFLGFILVVTALYFLNPGPAQFEKFIVREGGQYAADAAGDVGEAVAGANGRDVASWLAERVGREVAGEAAQAFERENYHVASTYSIDLNGRRPGGEWTFLGVANVFFPIEKPEINL